MSLLVILPGAGSAPAVPVLGPWVGMILLVPTPGSVALSDQATFGLALSSAAASVECSDEPTYILTMTDR